MLSFSVSVFFKYVDLFCASDLFIYFFFSWPYFSVQGSNAVFLKQKRLYINVGECMSADVLLSFHTLSKDTLRKPGHAF